MATTSLPKLTRRNLLSGLAGATAALSSLPVARAAIGFEQGVAAFRSKATARGVSEETYTRAMRGVQPDMTGVNADPQSAGAQSTALAISQPRRFGLEGRGGQSQSKRICIAASAR